MDANIAGKRRGFPAYGGLGSCTEGLRSTADSGLPSLDIGEAQRPESAAQVGAAAPTGSRDAQTC